MAPTSPPPTSAPFFGPPPGPPVIGSPGHANGAVHDFSDRPHRRRRVLTVFIIIMVLALVAGIAGVAVFRGTGSTTTTPATASTSPAARRLLQSALAAAGDVNSFHYVATSTLSGTGGSTQKTIGDAGPDRGRQVITQGNQKFTVLVIGAACYFKGNAPALISNLNLSSSSAAANAGQWISLAPTDAPYATVYAAVTAPSALADNITVVPQNVSSPTRVDGRRIETVTGAIAKVNIAGQVIAPKGTATLAVRASAPHLPVRYVERSTQKTGSGARARTQTTTSTVSFSRWGESVSVAAPSGAVSYASLGVGSTPVPTSPSGTVLT